jgi:hypothetical protein
MQRVPLVPLCVLLGSGLLASCGLEKSLPSGSIKDAAESINDAVSSIADAIAPPARPRVTKGPGAPSTPRRPQTRAQASVVAEPGRCHDVPSCETLLRKMTEGPDRSWIDRTDSPEALLTGVRMFAFRTLRPKLTCLELSVALEQLRGVPAALRPPPAGSSPEDIARTTRLAAEVHDELRAENEARCKAATSPPPSRPPAPPPAAREPQRPEPSQPPPSPPPALAQPPVTTQPPPPSQPPVTTQPPAPNQPTITIQPPPAPPQPQPRVTIPDQPERPPEKQ